MWFSRGLDSGPRQRCNGGVGPRARARTTLAAASVAAVIVICACGGGGHSHVTESASATATRAASRCIPAPIHDAAPPAWTASAWPHSTPGLQTPYALASNQAAAAFLFAPRLRVGHRTDPANKVLWIMRYPRGGHPLRITARSGADPAHAVTFSLPADSSPGEIYPSYVDLPRPGCWQLSLAWGVHRASIDLTIHPS